MIIWSKLVIARSPWNPSTHMLTILLPIQSKLNNYRDLSGTQLFSTCLGTRKKTGASLILQLLMGLLLERGKKENEVILPPIIFITHAQYSAWVIKWAPFLRFGVILVHANLCMHTLITFSVCIRHIGFSPRRCRFFTKIVLFPNLIRC